MIAFVLIAMSLLFLEFFYIKIADKYNIIDTPNHRSAHTKPTIRGGGIVVVFAFILYALFYQPNINYYFLLTGVLLVSVISFIDDIITLSSKVRILAHLMAFTSVFYSLNIIDFSSITTIAILIVVYVFSIGFLNIYNFMDGINGITFLNALASYSTLLYLNNNYSNFTDSNLLIIVIFALCVFGYYNFRKKAVCFAGDIGSITLGFTLIYFVLKLYFITYNVAVFLIFSVYLLEGGWTIIERFFRKENIFEAHKRHLYQILANNFKIAHLKISFLYFVLQMIINVIVAYLLIIEATNLAIPISMFFLLSVIYISIKFKVIKRIK